MSAPGCVMLDVEGLALSAADRQRLAHPNTGGVILFARNFATRPGLLALVGEIRAHRSGLLIAVDHEGGRVQRFRSEGFTRLPAARRLGALWDSDPAQGAIRATEAALALGYVLARELVACGIDLSFTPVLDLDYGVSGVIGDRALHADPRVVTFLARSLNHGLALAGMGNCGKHFPGHGFVALDSHLDLPIDGRSEAEILAADAAPYDWLGSALAAVMPAHVTYPAVDRHAAGFSRRWLQEILRGRFGFEGVIFSDDLSMAGAQAEGDIVSAGHAALRAGCDMVLVCNAPESAERLLAGLVAPVDPFSARRIARLPRAAAQGPIDLETDPVYARCHATLAALLP